MGEGNTTTIYAQPVSAASSRPISEAVQSLKSNPSVEEGIEEAFGPPRDEEKGFHQHGGHHDDEKERHDPDLVDWDGPNDPANPMNWSLSRKWWISMLTAFMTFVISFGSSVFSATTEVTAEEFGASSEVMILGVTLYVVGFACGYVDLSPSEGSWPPLTKVPDPSYGAL